MTHLHESSSSLPRGTCPSCGRNVALRKGGLVREHRAVDDAAVCRGSGFLAPEARDEWPYQILKQTRFH